MLRFKSNSVEETQNIAKKLAKEVYAGVNILVFGEMGAGKTHFIKAFLEERGVTEINSSSPTYTFSHYYKTERETLIHYDVYRMSTQEDIGADEHFLDNTITAIIEWPEKLEEFPDPRIEVRIKKLDENTREITIEFIGFSLPEKKLENLIKKYKIPKHVQAHTDAVALVSKKLTKELIKKGFILDAETIYQAALLHDLVRYVDFKGGLIRKNFPYEVDNETWNFWLAMRKKHKGQHHSEVVHDILEKIGYHTLGKLVLAHKSKKILEGFENTGEKIIHYADKRSKHEKIVPLQERLDDLHERYFSLNPDEKFWKELEVKNKKLEKELGGEILDI